MQANTIVLNRVKFDKLYFLDGIKFCYFQVLEQRLTQRYAGLTEWSDRYVSFRFRLLFVALSSKQTNLVW